MTTYLLRMSTEELVELKRIIESAEPTEALQEVQKQIDIALFQSRLKEGDWFKHQESGEVYHAYAVDHDWGQVWYFDPYTQSESAWVDIEKVAPVTQEEIEQAKKCHEELTRRYEERCEMINAFLEKNHPGGRFELVDRLDDEAFPEDIEVDGKVIGQYAWVGGSRYHYTVNMAD